MENSEEKFKKFVKEYYGIELTEYQTKLYNMITNECEIESLSVEGCVDFTISKIRQNWFKVKETK